MATSFLMKGRYIPYCGLNSLKVIIVLTTEPNNKKNFRREREKISIYLVRLTLVVICFSARYCDAVCRVRERKSKLELFHLLFMEHF